MGCCEVKKEIINSFEVDLHRKNDDSFNDLSISSHHCHTSSVFPENQVNTKGESRVRSVSNTLEQAFIQSSPQITRTSEITKTVMIITNDETEGGDSKVQSGGNKLKG